jgi:hypothetical protein
MQIHQPDLRSARISIFIFLDSLDEPNGSRAHLVGHEAHLLDAERYGTGGKPPCSRRPTSPSLKGGMGAGLLMKWVRDIWNVVLRRIYGLVGCQPKTVVTSVVAVAPNGGEYFEQFGDLLRSQAQASMTSAGVESATISDTMLNMNSFSPLSTTGSPFLLRLFSYTVLT